MRLHFALLLAHALAALSPTAAPVPKQPPAEPPAIKADQVVGTWAYSWGQWPDGIISFDKDGSYSAVHVPGGATVYAGTWTVRDNTLTITEYSFDFATGERRGGPSDYCFDFGRTRMPDLAGVSNGSTPVKLSNPNPKR